MLQFFLISCALDFVLLAFGAGFWDPCRVMAPSQIQRDQHAILSIDESCKTGTVEWHYPQFDKGGLKIIWPQGSKVCILSTSIIDLLSNTADIGTGGVLDLSTISSQGNDDSPSHLCVDRVNEQELSLVFHSDVRTYVQMIDYEIQ